MYLPALLKPPAVALRALLWAVWRGLERVPAPPAPGRVSQAADPAAPDGFYEAVGYRLLGGRAVRVDMLERFAADLRRMARDGRFRPPPALLSGLGLGPGDAPPVLTALGYVAEESDDGPRWSVRRRRPVRRSAPA